MVKEDYEMVVCNPTMFEMMLETSGNKLVGIFAPFAMSFIYSVMRFLNSTLVFKEGYPGVGQPIGGTGMYDGCLGKLQRGEADLIFVGLDYPLDIVNINQGFIALDEQITFSGLFSRPESVHKADFSRSLNAFHWSLYLLILFYLVVFGLICKVRSRLRKWMSISCIPTNSTNQGYRGLRFRMIIRKRIQRRFQHSPGFIDVFRNFIGSNFIEPDSLVFHVIIVSLNVFSFLILAYFNSLLNTDLVILGQAVIYENYDEIMKAGVRPMFPGGMVYFHDLKNAQEGSKGKEFWEWAVKKFGEENLFMPVVKKTVAKTMPEMIEGNVVVFAGDKMASIMRSSMCGAFDRSFDNVAGGFEHFIGGKLDKKHHDVQMYTRTDPSAPSKIKSIAFGKRVLDWPLAYSNAKKCSLGHLNMDSSKQPFELPLESK